MARVGVRELANLGRVIAGGQLSRFGAGENGFTARFERQLAEKIGVKHTLVVNSGTSALVAALVGAGIGPGDEVLVPAYTWVATAVAPLAVGAVPVLVEIDETLTMDPEDIEPQITPHTKAIIPVHMLNVVSDMDAINAIARRHNLVVIEDACQGVGVSYKGRRVGSLADAGAFSFNQYKNISAGEGGAVLTNDDRIFTRARMYHDVGNYIREHEFEGNEPIFPGVNLRVSELTGAVLHAQLSKLDPMLKRLRRRYEVVSSILSKSSKFRISPHNDPASAVGLTIIFDKAQEAKAFSGRGGVERLIDTGRHVYRNWEPLFSQRGFHDRMNPYRWAHRDISFTPDMCPRTLDILSRTCRVPLRPHYPTAVVRALTNRLMA